MTNTVAAGSVAGHLDKDKDKEKVEKRRALGRGLESLLPGPRAVGAAGARLGTQVATVSGDAATRPVAAPPHAGMPHGIEIRAVVDEAGESELRSEGRTNASVPTQPLSTQTVPTQPIPTQPLPTQTVPTQGPADGTISISAQADSRVPGNLVVSLAIRDIDKNPFQTRYVEDDEALEELAESIKANGVVQPIMVRPSEDEGRYILILGERRLHASKKAGKTHIPAMVRRVSLQQAAEMTIIENLQREDLSALEQAEAFRVLSRDFNMTQQQIGERVGLSRVSIANYMRLLKLPQIGRA